MCVQGVCVCGGWLCVFVLLPFEGLSFFGAFVGDCRMVSLAVEAGSCVGLAFGVIVAGLSTYGASISCLCTLVCAVCELEALVALGDLRVLFLVDIIVGDESGEKFYALLF